MSKVKEFFKKIDKRMFIRITLALLVVTLGIVIASVAIDNQRGDTVKDKVEDQFKDDGNAELKPLE